MMISKGLIVRLEAKPGKEAVADFFAGRCRSCRRSRDQSPGSHSRPARPRSRSSTSSPTKTDAAPTSRERSQPRSRSKDSELLAQPPLIESVDALATKLP